MNKDLKEARRWTKGKIAETIFWLLFRDDERFIVLPYAYEHVLPQLAQYRSKLADTETVGKATGAPDFLIISADRTKIRLVDVKYRSEMDFDWNKRIAHKAFERWGEDCCYFFATPKGFFMIHARISLKLKVRYLNYWKS